MWGVRCESIKKHLLGEKTLDFEKAVELATSLETASKDATEMSTTKQSGAAAGSIEVNYV